MNYGFAVLMYRAKKQFSVHCHCMLTFRQSNDIQVISINKYICIKKLYLFNKIINLLISKYIIQLYFHYTQLYVYNY